MSKHTDGARGAAKGIWKDGKITLHSDTDYDAFIESATTIIDQKTGLPEITAERDRLRESIESLEDKNKYLREAAANVWDATVETVGADDDRIDRLEAERAKLVEACKLAEAELEYLLLLKSTQVRPSGLRALKAIKYALAKAETESGEKDDGS